MATIRQIKTFVAKREIGYLLISHCHRQSHPVMKRRVNDFIMRQTAVRACQTNVTYLTSPALDQANAEFAGQSRLYVGYDLPFGQHIELVIYEID